GERLDARAVDREQLVACLHAGARGRATRNDRSDDDAARARDEDRADPLKLGVSAAVAARVELHVLRHDAVPRDDAGEDLRLVAIVRAAHREGPARGDAVERERTRFVAPSRRDEVRAGLRRAVEADRRAVNRLLRLGVEDAAAQLRARAEDDANSARRATRL